MAKPVGTRSEAVSRGCRGEDPVHPHLRVKGDAENSPRLTDHAAAFDEIEFLLKQHQCEPGTQGVPNTRANCCFPRAVTNENEISKRLRSRYPQRSSPRLNIARRSTRSLSLCDLREKRLRQLGRLRMGLRILLSVICRSLARFNRIPKFILFLQHQTREHQTAFLGQ